jgi:lipopolysaccharide export LptBFGC system permease protein LptF
MVFVMCIATFCFILPNGRFEEVNVVISIAISVITYAILMSLITVAIPRYVAPIQLMAWLAAAVLLVRLPEALRKRNVLAKLAPDVAEKGARRFGGREPTT